MPRISVSTAPSIYEYALYAFRFLEGTNHNVYVKAALRDYNAKQIAQRIQSVDDAFCIVNAIEGKDSIFGSRNRIAMPDETLYFNTGSDRDRALLLYTLLGQSPIADEGSTIELSGDDCFVVYGRFIYRT